NAGRAVGDAGVFMHTLEGSEEPDLVLRDGTAERSHIVLAGERLFRIWCRVLDGKARIQCGLPVVERPAPVPFIAPALGGNHYRTRRGPTRVGVFVRCAHGKFLNTIRREVFRKPPIQSSEFCAPSTDSSLFNPELPPVETAVMRAFVGSEGSTGSVPGTR